MTRKDKTDNDYTDGCIYEYTTKMPLGDHTYHFIANDSYESSRSPSTDYYSGPSVANKPSEPENLTFSIENKIINLKWTPPTDDGGEKITSYKIYRGTESENLNYYDHVENPTASYKDTPTVNNYTYYYQIQCS